jgi:hypothetical protein
MSSDLATYVKDAIVRLKADAVSSQNGSHAAGIFNKAANGFEKRILSYTAAVTRRSDLGKLTLGKLIEILEKQANADSDPLRGIIASSKQVNAPWKKVKHGDDPPLANLLNGLRKMLDVLNKLPS